MRFGTVELSRLEIHASERRAQFGARRWFLLDDQRLKQRRSRRIVLFSHIRKVKGRRGGKSNLCFDELRCGDESDARATLDPHLAVYVKAGCARAPAASLEEHAERVGVAVRVCGPVFDAGVDDVELEGEEVLEDVRACGWGLDGRERAKEVGHFGGDLVEEAEAGEGGEAEGPELCRECQEVSFFLKG